VSKRFRADGPPPGKHVLVDTSVWIDHLRKRNATLVQLLESMQIVTHPFVIGELACGNLANRATFLDLLAAIPQLPPVTHDEALGFVDAKKLMGRGLGWIDMHLLACAGPREDSTVDPG